PSPSQWANSPARWSNASAVKSRLEGHQAPCRAPCPIEGESRRRKGRVTTHAGAQTWELSNAVDDVSTCSGELNNHLCDGHDFRASTWSSEGSRVEALG